MSLKSGILSDREFNKNCLSYKAYPVGYANTDFEGMPRNPMLNGIKTPKYQRAAPKPMSADVRAVNAAKMMPGNSFQNARNMLEEYKREIQVWNPAKVSVRSAEADYQDLQDFLEKRGEDVYDPFGPLGTYSGLKEYTRDVLEPIQAANAAKFNVAAFNRGDQILRQSISTQATLPNLNDYLTMFYQLPTKEAQVKAAQQIYQSVRKQGVDLDSYGVSWSKMSQGSVQERQQELTRMIQAANAAWVSIDYRQFLSPLSMLPSVSAAVQGSVAGSSSVAGDTSLSDAATQQGIAQSPLPVTTSEVEKK